MCTLEERPSAVKKRPSTLHPKEEFLNDDDEFLVEKNFPFLFAGVLQGAPGKYRYTAYFRTEAGICWLVIKIIMINACSVCE